MYMIASGKIIQDKTKYSHSDLTEIILVGLLVNFGNRKVEYKRLHYPDNHAHHVACDLAYPVHS